MSTASPSTFIRFVVFMAVLLLIPQGMLPTVQAAPPEKPKNEATAVAWSQDGTRVAVGAGDGKVAVFDAGSGKQVLNLTGHVGAPVTAVAYSPTGDVLASAGRDSTVQLWDATGKRLATLHGQEQAVLTLAFSPDGTQLVAGGEDSRVLVWDVASRTLEKVIGGNSDFVTAVAVSADGETLASATRDARITLRNARTFKEKATLLGHAGEVTSLAFSPDGKWLASGSADTQVKIWDMPTRSERRALKGHDAAVTAVAFSRNGSLASGGRDGKLEVWDPVRGVLTNEITDLPDAVAGVAFTPKGDKVVEGRANGLAKVRRAATGAVLTTLTLPDPTTTTDGSSGGGSDKPSRDKGTNNGKDPASTTKSSDADSSTLSQQAAPLAVEPLASGAGATAPILVVTSAADPYSSYYAEILRAEGLNSYDTAELGSLDPALLGGYDVVILAARGLSAAQVSAIGDWVTQGGNLIAMRPDAQLSGLLGLSGGSSTLSEGYLKVDTSSAPGNGIVADTIQFHGTADRYTLNGARAVATLYSDASTATTSPAVSLHSVGSQGGQAASFSFDLARSIVFTRQGNPAWAGEERDWFSPIRSDDLYYGAKPGDVQDDWIDLDKVAIPQADEQQRLLVNLILHMNADRKPLPRFWYLPRGLKAAVIMTGDDHANNGTEARFEQFLADSPAGCSVEDWECIRGTSYIYTGTPMTNAKASQFDAQGFEIGLHVETSCRDWTPASLENAYATQLAAFSAKYTGLPAPRTNRTHCLVWSDWSTQASVELDHGIRLDTNYYYWPPSWIQDRAGFFTGSGFPMRFTDSSGAVIDVYQAATQMTDESGQSYPYVIDTLLDRALGPEEYYGAFTINAHTDVDDIPESRAVVSSAKDRGVPVISAEQMLDWLDARNSSELQDLSWAGGELTFTVAPGSGARNLDMLVPASSTAGSLASVTRDGSAVTYETRTVKGADYALVRATAGTYVASYAQDTAGPTVSTFSPTDGATDVSQSTTVTAQFNEPLNPATVTADTYQLLDSADLPVQASVTYDPFARTAVLTPLVSLDPSTSYRAVLLSGGGGEGTSGITDTSGNPLAADTTWSFTTGSAPGCPCSIWPSSATPANQSVNDPNAVELGVKFRTDVDGFITGVRFFKGPQNTGTHTGTLWSASGQQLARATFTDETSSGWQQVSFDTPVAVTANTTYVASYHTTSGYYALDDDYFATSGVDSPPLQALAEGVSGSNGVYSYSGSPTFPTDSWRSSQYWVDVVFATSTGPDTPDTVPPTVTGTTPADGTTDVATTTTVTATFDEALDPATVTSSTFTLLDAADAPVPATVAYDTATRTATLTPDSALAEEATYRATVTGGAAGVTDEAGNPLAGDTAWTFTTAGPTQCPCSIWPGASTPDRPSVDDPNAIELGVKLRADVDGFITGVRFYKGAANTGTHTGTLWSASGQQLARATFTSETSSGWQQVSFDTPVAVTANTTYVASYHTTSGNYAADNDYFATSGVDTPPLRALAEGVSGSNGVYAYASSPTFPGDSWRSTNYWVDVVFTTTVAPDTTAPSVTGTTPADGATDVAASGPVTATFDEALDPATVSSSTFTLLDAADAPVPATVAYDTATRTATLTPDSALAEEATYRATVTGGAAGVTDTAGNALAADVTWTFTTAGPTQCPCSIWPSSATPSIESDNDRRAVELGVKFRADVDGFITGVRFYKGPQNTGTHTGSLWSASGEQLAEATFTSETSSGWQQVSFDTPVAVTANTTYVASYHTTSGRYAKDTDYFADGGVDTPPLHALAEGVSGSNGVYAYSGSPTFPTNSWRSTNYWVDVVFTGP